MAEIEFKSEITYHNPDPLHSPMLHVVFRGLTHELVRSEAYNEKHADKHGSYRIRIRAGVHLRDRATGDLSRLYDGSFSFSSLRNHPDAARVARKLGVTLEDLLAACGRRRSVVVVGSGPERLLREIQPAGAVAGDLDAAAAPRS